MRNQNRTIFSKISISETQASFNTTSNVPKSSRKLRFLIATLFCLNFILGFGQSPESEGIIPLDDHDHVRCGVTPKYIASLTAPPIQALNEVPSDFPATARMICGKFEVFFTDLLPGTPRGGFSHVEFGLARRNTLCAVLTEIQNTFKFDKVPETNLIRLIVHRSYEGDGNGNGNPPANPAPTTVRFAAAAGAFQRGSTTPRINNGFVYDMVTNGTSAAGASEYHAQLIVNFDKAYNSNGTIAGSVSFQSDHTTPTLACRIDLFTCLMHEMGHVLGFSSKLNANGVYGTNPNNPVTFSGLDWEMYKGDPLNSGSMQKLILGTYNSPYLNPDIVGTSIFNSDVWLSNHPAPDNHPISSGVNFTNDTPDTMQSLAHLDESRYVYTMRSRFSPGYIDEYVMGPIAVTGHRRRKFSDAEINLFVAMGYPLTLSYSASNHTLFNVPPYSKKTAGYSDADFRINSNLTDDVPIDFTVVNNGTDKVTIVLANDATLVDLDGDQIFVTDSTLTNIRGCGNGGNNHNQLQIINNGRAIVFTPRANYYGRAQFGFRATDGKEIGSWHIYTIDVTRGSNVNFPIGSNIILNGDYEEGIEVKRIGADEKKMNTSLLYGLHEGYFMQGRHLSDSRPFSHFSNHWFPATGGDFIRESDLKCNGTLFTALAGYSTSSFPTSVQSIGSHPLPANNVGLRYHQVKGLHNWNTLATPVEKCKRYILSFDYGLTNDIPNNPPANLPLRFDFTSVATRVIPATNFSIDTNLAVIPAETWQRITIPFTYCGETPSNFMNMVFGLGISGFFIDNLSLIEDTSPIALGVSITNPSPVCAGTSVTLGTNVTNSQCANTYLWQPGGQTTSSITFVPTVNNQNYTVTVNDGCTTATATTTVSMVSYSMNQLPSSSYCRGVVTQQVNFTGDAGVTFSWHIDRPDIGVNLAANGTGNFFPSFTTSTTLVGNVVATVTVTPSLNGCPGAPSTFTITLNNAAFVQPQSTAWCHGTATDAYIFSGAAGTTYTWSHQYPSIGLIGSGTGNIPSFVATNPSSTPVVSIVTVIPTLDGCTGSPVTFSINVTNPMINVPANRQYCHDQQTDPIAITGASGYIFSWTNNVITPSMGLPSSGNGSISPFIAKNPSSTPVVATITILSNPVCTARPPVTFTITVSNPTMSQPSNVTICPNVASQPINFTAGTGATFTWENSGFPLNGLAASGTGNIPSFIPVNNTSTAKNYTITVKPVLNGCVGAPRTFTLTIQPSPILNPINNIGVCSGAPVPAVNFTGTNISSFSWGNDNLAIGLAQSGTTNIASYTSPNRFATTTGTITVNTISSQGCPGIPYTFTISVSPKPTVSPSANPTYVCAADDTPVTLSTPNQAGVTYNWTYPVNQSTSGNPVSIVTTTNTTYTVTANRAGCLSTPASVAVQAINCEPCIGGQALGNNTTRTITGTPAANQIYRISNDVTIVGTVTLRLSEVRMKIGTKIIVPNGSKLNIMGSHIYGCNGIWEGIEVQQGGRLELNSTPFIGVVPVSTLIEDARVAISVVSPNTLTAANVLVVNNTTFNRNEVAIRINGYNQNQATYPFVITNSLFTSRTIPYGTSNTIVNLWPTTSTLKTEGVQLPTGESPFLIGNYSVASLKAPYPAGTKPQAGIQLTNVGITTGFTSLTATPSYSEIVIGSPRTLLEPNINLFDNLKYGVQASSSNVKVVNSVFQNGVPLSGRTTYAAISATADQFSNNRLQVVSSTSSNTNNNRFFDYPVSIYVSDYLECDISRCNIRSKRQATITTPQIAVHGIYLQSNRFRSYQVNDNTLGNLQNGISLSAYTGTSLVGGSIFNGLYSGQLNFDRNTINEVQKGGISLSAIILSTGGLETEMVYNVPQSFISVSGSIMDNISRGIQTSNWSGKNVTIVGNTINLRTDPLSATVPHYGVSSLNNVGISNVGHRIFDNDITVVGNNIPSTNLQYRGVYVSANQNIAVECNTVSRTPNGIEFASGNSNTRFFRNTMSNHRYGFILSNSGVIGQQGDPLLATNNVSDNIWNGTWTAPNFKTGILSLSSSQNSKMYIRGGTTANGTGFSETPPVQTTNYSTANNSLIVITNPNPSTTLFNCPIVGIQPEGIGFDPIGGITVLENILAGIKLPDTPWEVDVIGKGQVYRAIADNPVVRNASQSLTDFYTENATGIFKQFATIENLLARNEFQNAYDQLQTIIPANNIEGNYKRFFELYLGQITFGLTDQDKIDLTNLALACPFTDGTVVYQARALYNSVFLTQDAFEDNCQQSQARRSAGSVENELNNALVIGVYPNPSTGSFNLQLNDLELTELSIRVTDINGKVVLNKTATLRNGKTDFELNEANGMYLLYINSAKGEEIHKLTIQK